MKAVPVKALFLNLVPAAVATSVLGGHAESEHDAMMYVLAAVAAPVAAIALPPPFDNLPSDPGTIIAWIIAALLAGWLAGLLVRGHGFGCLGDIALGLLGSVLGVLVLSLLHIQSSYLEGFIGNILVAFIGALILAAIGRLIGGGRRRTRTVVVHHRAPEWPGRQQ